MLRVQVPSVASIGVYLQMGIMLVITIATVTIIGMVCVVVSIVTETDTIEPIVLDSESTPFYKDDGIVILDD